MAAGSRRNAPLPPARRGLHPAVLAAVLVVLGASVALATERIIPLSAPAASPPAATATDDLSVVEDSIPPDLETDAGALESGDLPSDQLFPSQSPAAPELQAHLPIAVNGTTLTAESALGSAFLGGDPSSRAVSAAVASLGHKPDDLQVAYAYDEGGTLDLTVLGFRIAGLEPSKLEPLILGAWLSANTAGVKTTPSTISGQAVKTVVYGDEGPTEYVFIRGDSVYVVETTDQAIAAAAIAAMRDS